MVDRDLSGCRLGEFVLRERIGKGGSAAVYRAEQPQLNRHAVVKVLCRAEKPDVAEDRFLREAQLAARLDHPYAAHVYASGVEDKGGMLWIAMELVQGITLAEWLKANGPMPLRQFVPFFERLADVVHAAHERGIVHRDLKPANVMVIERAGGLFPKLLDFGIAKVSPATGAVVTATEPHEQLEPEEIASTWRRRTRTDPGADDYRLTPVDTMMGSLQYMPPEQWTNAAAVGRASDVYSLGVVAYEALTGHVPFPGPTTGEYYRQHLCVPVPPLGGEFSAGLDDVIERALAKEPGDRHADVLELAAELRRVLRAQPLEQLRVSAQQWEDQAHAPRLLWSGDMLAQVSRLTRTQGNNALGALECSFVAASQRRARRVSWFRRLLVVLVAAGILGGIQIRAVVRARLAERIVTEGRVEQGRQALLHGESSEAVRHLETAYERGERSQAVQFMLARALQPRMAELARFASGAKRVWSARFAPDGRRVLTADDSGARMWDAASGQLLFTMSHGDIVYQALFSADGSRIITAGGDGSVRLWNAATGAPSRELRNPRVGSNPWRSSALALSAHFIAAIDVMGREVHVWDAETGDSIAALENKAPEIGLLASSADGRWLAVPDGDGVRVFDASTWRQAVRIPSPRVRSMSFDPTGSRIAVGTYDGVAAIWEVASGRCLQRLRDAGESVDALAFSRDGTLIATASREGAAQVWDADSGGLRTQSYPHRGKIYAVEFSRDGDLLLSAGADGAVVVSNVMTAMPVARLEGPAELVLDAHFDQDAHRVVGASWDGTARFWDAGSPYRRWTSPPIGPECETAESLTPDQRFIALSCRNHGTRVWDTARDQLVADLPEVTAVGGDYESAFPALTATGDRAAIARGNTVEVYALPGGHLIQTITHVAAVHAVAFAPSGHALISGAVDGSLLLTRDQHDPVALPASPGGIDAATILADGRVIAADASRHLRVIDPRKRELLMDAVTPARTRLLRASKDGTRLVTILSRTQLTPPLLWDLVEHRLLGPLEGHVGRVFTARFVAAEREILTAGADGTARLWSAATGKLQQSFRGDSHFLGDAVLDPDGSVVVAGGSDGFLRFWDVASGRLLWKLQAHRSYIVGLHYEGDDLVTRAFAGDVSRWTLPKPDTVIDACHAAACGPVTPDGN